MNPNSSTNPSSDSKKEEIPLANQGIKIETSADRKEPETLEKSPVEVKDEEKHSEYSKSFEEMDFAELDQEHKKLKSILLRGADEEKKFAKIRIVELEKFLFDPQRKVKHPISKSLGDIQKAPPNAESASASPAIQIPLSNSVNALRENTNQPADQVEQMKRKESSESGSGSEDAPAEETAPPASLATPATPQIRKQSGPTKPEVGLKQPRTVLSHQQPPKEWNYAKFPLNPKIKGQYQVECILETREYQGQIFYLTFWAGKWAKPRYVTWEPSTHFKDKDILSINAHKKQDRMKECVEWFRKHSNESYLQGVPGEEHKKPNVDKSKDFGTGLEDCE